MDLEPIVVILALVALLAFQEWRHSRDLNLLTKSSQERLGQSEAHLRVYKRAQMHDLFGMQTKELHDLVYLHTLNKQAEFEALHAKVSAKVRGAFEDWERNDKPLSAPYA